MPRARRPLAPGLTYHVTNRGNDRAAIFHDAADNDRFLELLAEVVEEHAWSVLAYCLVFNHFHVLVTTPQPDLDRGMWKLGGDYARHHHRRYGTSGHLFQDRYHEQVVTRDAHLLTSLAYIACNPVEAGIVDDPAAWRWSSHHVVEQGLASEIVDRDALLRHTGALGGDPLERYADLVRARLARNASSDPETGDRPPNPGCVETGDRPLDPGSVEMGCLLAAVANDVRRRVLELLADGELGVTELVAPLGIARSTMSAHLSALRDAGLVECVADGRERRYSLVPERLVEVERWAGSLASAAGMSPEDRWLAGIVRAERGSYSCAPRA